MKLSKLYCNRPFHNITFNIESDKLNVVLGHTTKKTKEHDSHNLGKSKLIVLIDFLLLKKSVNELFLMSQLKKEFQLTPRFDKNGRIIHEQVQSLEVGKKLFSGYIFYLEILLNSGTYITIKRGIDTNTKISFKIHKERSETFENYTEWDYVDIPIDKAQAMLNEWLAYDFCIRNDEDYRAIVNYSLRSQGDYDYQRNSIFQLSKFKSRDIYWKPFMFALLGFDKSVPFRKYEIEKEIADEKKAIEVAKSNIGVNETERDSLVGQIQMKNSELEKERAQLDALNFYQQDNAKIHELVGKIEEDISAMNTALYAVEYDIQKLNKSIQSEFRFDLDRVKDLFGEVKIHFPDQLAKSYEQLLNFNKQIVQERNAQISQTIQEKMQARKELKARLMIANNKKSKYSDLIQDTSLFKKYNEYQRNVIQYENDITRFKTQLEFLDSLKHRVRELNDTKGKELDEKIEELNEIYENTSSNQKYSEIRRLFSEIVKKITMDSAYISWRINSNNNIEFECKYDESAKDEGNSYYKLLCIAFDLAVQASYSNESYYRFMYHDDAFANIGNARRIGLLQTIREICSKYNIQYIFSIISDDIPVNGFEISKDEIVIELNDNSVQGKLFYMDF